MPENAEAPTRAQSEAAKRLFANLFQYRHKRAPYGWETIVGQALLTGELKVCRPASNGALRAVHHIVDAVQLALGLTDYKEE